MNVLILSPDAVGGTLLERLLSIYMQFHNFGKPVINISHPESGLQTQYSPEFNRMILSKKGSTWGFYQSLSKITELYKSVDHYTVSKLTHYTMKRRQDTIDQLIPFYQHFDENCFVIACRRENVFEHALSWGITKISKAKNVYNHPSKILKFIDFYRDGIEIDPQSLVDSLEDYKEYLQWVEDHFSVASYYSYEKHFTNIEKYILSLPIFSGQPARISWQDVYGIEFNDWNRCHFLSSDIGSIALSNPDAFPQLVDQIKNNIPSTETLSLDWTMPRALVRAYDHSADASWPKIETMADYESLPDHIKQECTQLSHVTNKLPLASIHRNVAVSLPHNHKVFLETHSRNYLLATQSIEKMEELGVVQGSPPIKKQTLAEKKLMVKNFDQCLDIYNEWIQKNPTVGSMVSNDQLALSSSNEQQFWCPHHDSNTAPTDYKSVALPNEL